MIIFYIQVNLQSFQFSVLFLLYNLTISYITKININSATNHQTNTHI